MGLISIRDYREADWARLQAIHDAARMDELRLAGLAPAFVPLSEAAQREGLFEYVLRVAELDGTAAGFAAFTQDELAWLYVDPALSRRGVDGAARVHRSAGGERARPGALPELRLPGGGDRLRPNAGQ